MLATEPQSHRDEEKERKKDEEARD